jgi:hypothetical protein
MPHPWAITHFPGKEEMVICSEEETRNGGSEGSRIKDRVYVLLF